MNGHCLVKTDTDTLMVGNRTRAENTFFLFIPAGFILILGARCVDDVTFLGHAEEFS